MKTSSVPQISEADLAKMKNEIEMLRKQAKEESEKSNVSKSKFEAEIQRLKQENKDLKQIQPKIKVLATQILQLTSTSSVIDSPEIPVVEKRREIQVIESPKKKPEKRKETPKLEETSPEPKKPKLAYEIRTNEDLKDCTSFPHLIF
jgi:uncharacterized coiled-coil DUF342 family protein